MAFKNRESALGISKLETIQTNKQTNESRVHASMVVPEW